MRAHLHLGNPGAGIWGYFEVFWGNFGHFRGILGHFGIGAFWGIASRWGPRGGPQPTPQHPPPISEALIGSD